MGWSELKQMEMQVEREKRSKERLMDERKDKCHQTTAEYSVRLVPKKNNEK